MLCLEFLGPVDLPIDGAADMGGAGGDDVGFLEARPVGVVAKGSEPAPYLNTMMPLLLVLEIFQTALLDPNQ